MTKVMSIVMILKVKYCIPNLYATIDSSWKMFWVEKSLELGSTKKIWKNTQGPIQKEGFQRYIHLGYM